MESGCSTLSSKGLDNQPGENNCFLNSVIQALWHIDIFRDSLHNLKDDRQKSNNIIEALQVIFDNYKYCDFQVLKPDYLRRVLAKLNVDRFQLGQTNDAVECYEYILDKIHEHSTTDVDSATCEDDGCITHKKFTLTLINHRICPYCEATSEPEPLRIPLLYLNVSELVNEIYIPSGRDNDFRNITFGKMLRSVLATKESCPGNCRNIIKSECYLTNCPEIVSIGFSWSTKSAPRSTIQSLLYVIQTRISLNDVFSKVLDENAAQTTIDLNTMVVYYGMHYATFCHHTRYKKWILCDDAHIRDVGQTFEDVIQSCIRNCYQPVLLIYTNSSGKPMDPIPSTSDTDQLVSENRRVNEVVTGQLIDLEDSTSTGSIPKSDSRSYIESQSNYGDSYDGVDILQTSRVSKGGSTSSTITRSREPYEADDDLANTVTRLQQWSVTGKISKGQQMINRDISNKLGVQATQTNPLPSNAWTDSHIRKLPSNYKYYDKNSSYGRQFSGSDATSNSSGRSDDGLSFVTAPASYNHHRTTEDSSNSEITDPRHPVSSPKYHSVYTAKVNNEDEYSQKMTRTNYGERSNVLAGHHYQRKDPVQVNDNPRSSNQINQFATISKRNHSLDSCVIAASCGQLDQARTLCNSALDFYCRSRSLDDLDKHLHEHADELMCCCSDVKAKLDELSK
ncbi:uncharacterized protein TRIADDRAFT_51661 [Trichoplax adhaerens]|uniref:USP domain-containing protein n=1 Tax=Trichoplax adhaerens TaxID=10228 RepID=B3RKF4_TRIAD|nr:hypothetical protein TRIADDRAFT_51661 [Trichoplax adhaerens]EDV28588.1 hypothetical protein TRIADDRAFT_51661 [Trichoplax adhaerens]|eukprot:XP_002107790.1 hypothetical protein TRIADDRAFT_51661 [Trichoplax adhaerens]